MGYAGMEALPGFEADLTIYKPGKTIEELATVLQIVLLQMDWQQRELERGSEQAKKVYPDGGL